MYGYLKFKNLSRQSAYGRTYRFYYCGLCSAMKKNYGLLSTLFLSNDIAFIGILLSKHNSFSSPSPPNCCLAKGNCKIDDCYSSEYWKGLGALCLSLAYAKSYDNLLDDKCLKTRIKHLLISIASSKARKCNIELFEYMKDAMVDLSQQERNNIDFSTQSDIFAGIVRGAICRCLPTADSATLSMVSSIMKWLCLIDAIDDFDKDTKQNSYNPLFYTFQSRSESWTNTFNFCWTEVLNIYFHLTVEINNSISSYISKGTYEGKLIMQMLKIEMPEKLFRVMEDNAHE